MIGQSFAPVPSADPNEELRRRQEAAGGPYSNVGQAIRTLNLRYPRVVGAGAIAPGLLLNSPGAAGLPQQSGGMHPVLDAILRAVTGGYTPAQQTEPGAFGGTPSGSTIPPPRVYPNNPAQGSSDRPPYTPPVHTGPTEPRDRPEHSRENPIIGGGFEMGRGTRY